MVSWKNSIFIHAPPERVFAHVDDPYNFVAWLPGMIEVHNVVEVDAGNREGQQQEWTYKMVGVRLRGESVIAEHVPNAQNARELELGLTNLKHILES
jgi:hypothetical protein